MPLLRHVTPHLRRQLSLSAVKGPAHPPLCNNTLPEYWSNVVLAEHAPRPALICREEKLGAHGGPQIKNAAGTSHLAWNFEEFNTNINATARGLLTMGVKPGDRVAVIMGNNSAYAMLQWACASIGAILVTLNPAYRINEFAETLKLVGAKHLFVVPHIRSSAYVQMFAQSFRDLRNSAPGEIQEPLLPELKNFVVVNHQSPSDSQKLLDQWGLRSAIDWREILLWRQDTSEEAERHCLISERKPDEVINLQFTSGTTGLPKAVSLTHSNLLNNAISIGRCMKLTPSDVLCNVPPLFHCFGLVLGNLAAWVHASCIVYPSPIFNPPAIVDAISAERCTALHGVPTHFYGVLAEIERRRAEGMEVDTSRLRTGIAAGSPIPIELMKQLIDKLGLDGLTNAYGMTETSPVSFQTTIDDPLIKRVETVGRVQPHAQAKIIDKEGNTVPVGTPGEVCVAGYLLQKGYWEDAKRTGEVMRRDQEGVLWMHTGDEGILDSEGYLKIVGRIKDIIIRGGENLFPVQIENALCDDQRILEAAVVAVPDAKYGEVVGAWIVRKDQSISREEVKKVVADRMNPQNAPTWVWFIGEDGDELPKTASGKVQKHILRDWSKALAEKGVGKVI